MRKLISHGLFGLLLACSLAAPAAHAAEAVPPDVLAKTVTDEVLATFRAGPEIRVRDFAQAVELIESKILPHFDFQTMTRLVMGKNWAQATPEQRTALAREFRTLLARTYATSLALYRDQAIAYRPLKLAPGDTDVIVKSVIRQPGGEPISVDYRMEKTGSGWKVYDVELAGVSLVQNYRSVFSAEIQRSGIDGLIEALAEKNKAARRGR